MSRDPVLIAYSAQRRKDRRTIWHRIGRAFPHETGSGLTVLLDALPPDGRIILLELDTSDHRRIAAEARRHARNTIRRPYSRPHSNTPDRSCDPPAREGT